MELDTETILLQDPLIGPAFAVVDGIITQVNDAAAQRQIAAGTAVTDIIETGAQEFANYRSGKLYLQLMVSGVRMGAYVTKIQNGYLFCLESAYDTPELRAFALAAQHMRDPLSNAMLSTDLMQMNPTVQDDPALRAQLGQLSRGLYRLMRTVCNMSDAADCHKLMIRQELRDAASVFDEVFGKASDAAAQAKRTLTYKGLHKQLYCPLDADILGRAVLNLVSNAIRFSPEGSTIQASLQHSHNTLRVTVENVSAPHAAPLSQSDFKQFLREPGLNCHGHGLGLGMTIVCQAAAAHGGTVLFDSTRKNGAKVVMTIATNRDVPPVLRSPLQFVGGYTGGLDSLLVELADVLPDSAYEAF